MVRRFYLAVCHDCGADMPMPFYDGDERDRWATEHSSATGHDVRLAVEDRDITGGS